MPFAPVPSPAIGRVGLGALRRLARRDGLPEAAYGCFICTQTLQYIHRVAIIHHPLKPGGALLLTVPGIGQISPHDRDRCPVLVAARAARA